MARSALPRPVASGIIDNPMLGVDWHFVYRVYCRCDELLYVGLTDDPIRRLAGHDRGLKRSAWTKHLWTRVEWDAYRGRAKGAIAEQRTIYDLRPLYNKTHARRRVQWVDLPDPFFLTEAQNHQRTEDIDGRGQEFHDWLFREGGPADDYHYISGLRSWPSWNR